MILRQRPGVPRPIFNNGPKIPAEGLPSQPVARLRAVARQQACAERASSDACRSHLAGQS